ncbi:hypothetical protein [Brevundimonas sp.]|uniref:hypothetical protein n=1 Tax=Brevundimonas sp. TaxID=1871086 RepID=UPI0025DB59E6|nr:hypothetical protein [Brevundimonas sp.]
MRPAFVAVAGLLLCACQTSTGSAPVSPLPAALAGGSHISAVQLQNAPQGVSTTFRSEFEEGLLTRLGRCATGSTPLTVSVTLDGYNAANPALALFAPSTSQISGVARVLDAEGIEVGRYRIRRTFTMGGIGGAIAATGAESTMIDAFGDELCEQAFEPAS